MASSITCGNCGQFLVQGKSMVLLMSAVMVSIRSLNSDWLDPTLYGCSLDGCSLTGGMLVMLTVLLMR